MKLIYLICDQKDRKATVPVRKFLKQQGFEVDIPVFEGDSSKVREANKQLLVDCDGILLFYGSGCEAWKRSMISELRKMKGYREGNAPISTFTYLAEPRTDLKEDLIDMEEANLIDGMDGFSEEKMTEFVQAMKSKATV